MPFPSPMHENERDECNFAVVSGLAWRIPGTGEPGGLLFMGSHRVGHPGVGKGAGRQAGPGPSVPGILQARIQE